METGWDVVVEFTDAIPCRKFKTAAFSSWQVISGVLNNSESGFTFPNKQFFAVNSEVCEPFENTE
jgi:hypothetical protein